MYDLLLVECGDYDKTFHFIDWFFPHYSLRQIEVMLKELPATLCRKQSQEVVVYVSGRLEEVGGKVKILPAV